MLELYALSYYECVAKLVLALKMLRRWCSGCLYRQLIVNSSL